MANLLPLFCSWSRPASAHFKGCWVVSISPSLLCAAPPAVVARFKALMVARAFCAKSGRLCLLLRPDCAATAANIAALSRPHAAGSQGVGAALPW